MRMMNRTNAIFTLKIETNKSYSHTRVNNNIVIKLYRFNNFIRFRNSSDIHRPEESRPSYTTEQSIVID